MNLFFANPLAGVISFGIGLVVLTVYYIYINSGKDFLFTSDLEQVFGSSRSFIRINLVLLLLLLVGFSLLAADPKLSKSESSTSLEGIDIAIVLDMSYSMMAQDIEPNRLEVAKDVISSFTSKLESDRVGLVLFSGTPFTSVPLTFDYEFITNYIKSININFINQDISKLQGTAIGDGLLYGAKLLENDDIDDSSREKVIVLFTDGEANKGIDPIEAVKYVKAKGYKVYTVGIGGNEDTYVDFKTSRGTTKQAVGGIDEENLKTIANATGGEYYRADTKDTFEDIFNELDLLNKGNIEVSTIDVKKPFYSLFIVMVVFLLCSYTFFNSYYNVKV